jgi:hypothetical protein
MSQAKISRIETGKVLPTVIDVEQIVRALGVPRPVADELLALARAANVDYASWRAYARLGIWRKQAEIKKLSDSPGWSVSSSRRFRRDCCRLPTSPARLSGPR